jgi:hypothetical protein
VSSFICVYFIRKLRLYTVYYFDDQIKEKGGACSTRGEMRITENLVEKRENRPLWRLSCGGDDNIKISIEGMWCGVFFLFLFSFPSGAGCSIAAACASNIVSCV